MEKIETDKDLRTGMDSDGAATVRKYLAERKLSDDEFKSWLSDCRDIRKRYRDEQADKHAGRFNIFWANIENQKANIFYRAPKAEIRRRYKDRNPIARLGAEIWERNTQYSIDSYESERVFGKARDEYLMYSRGQVRVRYSAEIVSMPQEFINEEGMIETREVQVKKPGSEKTYCEFVPREQFSHSPGCKTWEEVTWVCFDAYMTRDELIEQFGEEKGRKVKLTYNFYDERKDENLDASLYKKALVHEFWDKKEKKTIWISPGYKDDVLDEEEDPLGISGFFPCPMPAYMCLDTDSLVPIPEFKQVEALTKELDEIGYRKAALTRALAAKGIYDSTMEEVANLAQDGAELELIPSKNFKAILDKGGANGLIAWLPIEQIANVLRSMIEIEANLKQQLYEVSGQSDIIRGATDPRETARAQSLKSQYANKRQATKEQTFSYFVRDVVKIMAEVIIEHYDPETIAMIADLQSLGPQAFEQFQMAYELLQNEKVRNYRIDIETDSTLAADDNEEKEQVVEFFNVLTQGLNDALPIIQARPETAKVLTEALVSVGRRFKIGRTFEDALDEFADAVSGQGQMPMQPGQPGQQQPGQPPQPGAEQQQPPQIDPRIVTSQNESEAKMAQLQAEMQDKERSRELEFAKHQDKMGIEQQKINLKAEELQVRQAREVARQGGFTI